MDAQHQHTAALPQGFSVYQPALGQQLQFFPAVGTPQLDELINAYVPGPASAQEKRAAVSLDFLEFSQLTGESFKFYPVYAVAESPVAASPLQDSLASSFSVSPVTPNWDFGYIASSAASSSSRRSSNAQVGRSSRKASSPSARQPTTDFSHLPGMKILTRDGLDVTNSAARGSKTKEQRDHAHLMRVIKACDSCKKKKVRCDPSHKKRGSSQQSPASSSSQPAQTASKKAKLPAPKLPDNSAAVVVDEVSPFMSPFELDPAFLSTDLVDWDPTLALPEPWEEFVNYPSEVDSTYDFFLDPADLLSPESSFASSAATTISSPSSADTPSSQSNPSLQQRTDGLAQGLRLQTCGGPLQVLGQAGTPELYEDFNLYSPSSSFSEDERMISIGSSCSPSSQQPVAELGPSAEQISGGATRLTEGGYAVLQESSRSTRALGDEWYDQSSEIAGLESIQPTTEGAANGSTQDSGLVSAPESKVQPGGDERVVRHSDLCSGLTRTTVPESTALAQSQVVTESASVRRRTGSNVADVVEAISTSSPSHQLQLSSLREAEMHDATQARSVAYGTSAAASPSTPPYSTVPPSPTPHLPSWSPTASATGALTAPQDTQQAVAEWSLPSKTTALFIAAVAMLTVSAGLTISLQRRTSTPTLAYALAAVMLSVMTILRNCAGAIPGLDLLDACLNMGTAAKPGNRGAKDSTLKHGGRRNAGNTSPRLPGVVSLDGTGAFDSVFLSH